MQRKPSYYVKKFAATAIAAAAGLVVGVQIETNQATTRSNTDTYFVMQAYASDAFIQFATPSPSIACTEGCVDPDRECGAGVETECIYL